MNISIQEEIIQAYPQYKMGLVKIKTISQDWNKLQTLTKYEKSIADKAQVENDWLAVFNDMHASERRLPSVVALWSIIDRFGTSASQTASLATYGGLKPINYFVDAYNFISIKHGIPMGGYDLTKLPHNELKLQHAVQGGVKFQPMGLSGQFEKLKDPAEICYYSGDTPVCRYWNHKDSEITKIVENTNEVLIMFDTLGNLAELENAMTEFVDLIKQTAEIDEIKTEILSDQKLETEM